MKKILFVILLSISCFTSFSQDVIIEPSDLSKTFIKVKEPQQYDGYVVDDPKTMVVYFYRILKNGQYYLVGRKIINTIIWDRNYLLSNKKVKLKVH